MADEVLDLDIRIGNVMPYTGELAPFATIGKAEAAYFDMINAQGGINGRKVRFISHDDGADPVTTRQMGTSGQYGGSTSGTQGSNLGTSASASSQGSSLGTGTSAASQGSSAGSQGTTRGSSSSGTSSTGPNV